MRVESPLWAFSTSARVPTATILPAFTASASTLGCRSSTVTMSPPV
jgi:hypothetical protein